MQDEEFKTLVREAVKEEFAHQAERELEKVNEEFRAKVESRYRHQKALCREKGLPPPIPPPWMMNEQKPETDKEDVKRKEIEKKTIRMGCVAFVFICLGVLLAIAICSK